MKYIVITSAIILLAGCAGGPLGLPSQSAPTEPQAAAPALPQVAPHARTVDEFDTTSAADKAQAAKASLGGVDLGVTIASLGAPGEPGFWLKTPLVKTPGPGRVAYLANGKSVKVDLIPTAGEPGAGSRISLAALRVIEAPLTGLPELRVFSLK